MNGMKDQGAPERRAERRVDFHEFAALRQDITDMKSLMSSMVETMGRITVIEERQHAMAVTTNKTLERVEVVTLKLHEHEVEAAVNASIAAKVEKSIVDIQALTVENEKNKARFETAVWLMRGLWAVAGLAAFVFIRYAPSMMAG